MSVKTIFNVKANKNKYIAIFCFGVLNALYLIFQDNTAVMEWVSHHITDRYKYVMGNITNLFPFSVAEVVIAAFVVFCIYYTVSAVLGTIKAKGARVAFVFSKVLGCLVIALSVSTALTFFWGINYYAHSAVEEMGYSAKPIKVEDLQLVTTLFADMLNDAAQNVPRDENGLLDVDRQQIYDDSLTLYAPLELKYSYLQGAEVMPKKMAFSRFMSETNYTGIFFPLTGEANINKDQPLCLLPSTIAHELAHVRGVAPEDDCNFIAVLACEESGNDVYKYSGRLLAYIHLSNALYTADADYARSIYATLNDGVKADLAENSRYWAQFESPAADVADTMYDGFLQSYGQEDGIKSYGRVTDLLCDKYIDMAQQMYEIK